jgi:hypothetical protein
MASLETADPKTLNEHRKRLRKTWTYAGSNEEEEQQMAQDAYDLRFIGVPHPEEQQTRKNLGPCGDHPCFGCEVGLGCGDTIKEHEYKELLDIWYKYSNFSREEEGAIQMAKYFEENIRSVYNTTIMEGEGITEEEMKELGWWIYEWSAAQIKWHMDRETKNAVAARDLRLRQLRQAINFIYDKKLYVRDAKDPSRKAVLMRTSVIPHLNTLQRLEMDLWRLNPAEMPDGKVYVAENATKRGLVALRLVDQGVRAGMDHSDL